MGLPSFIGWIPDNTTGITTPSGGKLSVGWLSTEKPPFQYMNWFFNLVSQWVNRLGPAAPTVVVGSAAYCTHATLAAAVADGGVGTNINVLLTESQTIATTVSLTKAGWHISALPGVTLTKSGAVTGLSCEADGIHLVGIRFSGWSSGGDRAVYCTAAWTYGRVLFCNFLNCGTEVDDGPAPAGKKPITLGNITE